MLNNKQTMVLTNNNALILHTSRTRTLMQLSLNKLYIISIYKLLPNLFQLYDNAQWFAYDSDNRHASTLITNF